MAQTYQPREASIPFGSQTEALAAFFRDTGPVKDRCGIRKVFAESAKPLKRSQTALNALWKDCPSLPTMDQLFRVDVREIDDEPFSRQATPSPKKASSRLGDSPAQSSPVKERRDSGNETCAPNQMCRSTSSSRPSSAQRSRTPSRRASPISFGPELPRNDVCFKVNPTAPLEPTQRHKRERSYESSPDRRNGRVYLDLLGATPRPKIEPGSHNSSNLEALGSRSYEEMSLRPLPLRPSRGEMSSLPMHESARESSRIYLGSDRHIGRAQSHSTNFNARTHPGKPVVQPSHPRNLTRDTMAGEMSNRNICTNKVPSATESRSQSPVFTVASSPTGRSDSPKSRSSSHTTSSSNGSTTSFPRTIENNEHKSSVKPTSSSKAVTSLCNSDQEVLLAALASAENALIERVIHRIGSLAQGYQECRPFISNRQETFGRYSNPGHSHLNEMPEVQVEALRTENARLRAALYISMARSDHTPEFARQPALVI